MLDLIRKWKSDGKMRTDLEDDFIKDICETPEDLMIKLALPLVNYKDLLLDSYKKTAGLRRIGQSIDLGGIGKGFAGDKLLDIFRKYGISSAFTNLGGNPSESSLISVTIVTKNSMTADVLSTAFFISGVIVGIIIVGIINWERMSKEHREAKNLPIATIDFNNIKDGIYIGSYEGGMYKWRINEVQVTISDGKVNDIKLLKERFEFKEANKLYSNVIQAQSLQADTISGATLTSKAYLKSIEKALIKAQKFS